MAERVAERVGTQVIDILEHAGERFLSASAPKLHRNFLLQIGGAPTLRCYQANPVYWEAVQAILDCFFSSAERAEICRDLIEALGLRTRAEAREFLARALAEQRLQLLIAAAKLRSAAAAR